MDLKLGKHDVAIIGGGVIGSAIAHFVKTLDPGASVVVIEPDPAYAFASSLRQSGGCRVQFTRPENIQMSRYSIDYFRNFAGHVPSQGGLPGDAGWVDGGYLFIVPPEATAQLERNVRLQIALGCEVELLTPRELETRFPSMRVDDLGAAAYTPRDGWCDPERVLRGFRQSAEGAGVRYVPAKVVALQSSQREVRAARLSDGTILAAEAFVNAAGAWAAEIAALAGMVLPVSPMKRLEHAFSVDAAIEPLPYVKDVGRMAIRSDGSGGFKGGLVDWRAPRGVDFSIDDTWFDRVVRPAATHRFPSFAHATCRQTWSGLYEVCDFDKNPVIGRWNAGKPNLLTAAGFSGHGLMHAPAVGRAIAELLTRGRYETIDLSAFSYERIAADRPAAETGIV